MPTKMSKSNFADNRVVKGKGKGKLKGKFKAEVKDIDWASLSAFEDRQFLAERITHLSWGIFHNSPNIHQF